MKKLYTENQRKVIGIKFGYNMVLAGPGCGKTDILAERIVEAYEKDNVSFDDMLCLTFTNRAARGMFKRIQERLAYSPEGLFVGNIHRYCSHFLYDNALIHADSSIMDEDDTGDVIQYEITDEEIKSIIGYQEVTVYREPFVRLDWNVVNDMFGIDIYPSGSTGLIKAPKASKIMGMAKSRILQMQHLIQQIRMGHPEKDLIYRKLWDVPYLSGKYRSFNDFADVAAEAEYDGQKFWSLPPDRQYLSLGVKIMEYKDRNKLVDFDDLLILTYDVYFKDRTRTYKRYPWIQIDEIQDLSGFQISLLDLMADTSRDFSIVYLGDEQQAIYSFMGASMDTLDMLKSRCGQNIFRLDKNFRSPKYLLDIYNEYAEKVLNIDRDFLPEAQDNIPAGRNDVNLHIYSSFEEEDDRIFDAILPFLRKSAGSGEKTALLVPWNSDANKISDRLILGGVTHFKISGTDIFQSVHMKTLLAHFSVVYNDFNLLAWSRILKQTYAVDSYSDGRHLVERMNNMAMTPSDLMRDDGSTYLAEFCRLFDHGEIVIFDTETTGVDVYGDDIVQIAAIKVRNGAIVSGSEFNIFLETERHIPEMLGSKVNPLVEEYRKARKTARKDGLSAFVRYAGSAVLVGHNVNYDYNILQRNLLRDCPEYGGYSAVCIDTLHLVHLLYPRFKKYRLEYLLERLNLSGKNSHLANDDIMATYEVAKRCSSDAKGHLQLQRDFISSKMAKQIKEELSFSYKECYEHSRNLLYSVSHDGPALTGEMEFADKFLTKACEIRSPDRFGLVMDFLKYDVIKPDEINSLYTHLSNHLMDLCTYREADLCESSGLKENLFISTVHKAKGLEFDNVIVMRAVSGRYPHFAHALTAQQDEDKRLFYVAMSRAKKRLIVTGVSSDETEITPYIVPVVAHFCIRFVLYESIGTKILAELYGPTLTIRDACGSQDVLARFTVDMDKLRRSYGISDRLEFRNFLMQRCCNGDVVDSITAIMSGL